MDRKELAKNLKLCNDIPKEIEAQQSKYKAVIAELDAKEKGGDFARNALARQREAAKAERDKTVAALAERLKAALNYVAANNNYNNTETVDFTNSKLQDALRTVEFMGKDLSFADQAGILNAFRSDIGALRVLEKAFAKEGLYMKDAAYEMQKAVPNQAIEELAQVLAFYDYAASQNRFDFPMERAAWTRDAFSKQLDRLGLNDEAADVNPYSAVLEALADKVRADAAGADYTGVSDEERKTAYAKADARAMSFRLVSQRVRDAAKNGEDPAHILNRQLSMMEQGAATQAGA